MITKEGKELIARVARQRYGILSDKQVANILKCGIRTVQYHLNREYSALRNVPRGAKSE